MKKLCAALAMLMDTLLLALRRWLALPLQAAGFAAAFLLFYLLLLVPDSHVWSVAISAVGWPALAVAALWMQVLIFRRIVAAVPPMRLKFAVPMLLLWVVLWSLLWHWLAHFAGSFGLYASYLNSRLPAPGRATLTYQRLLGLFDDLYFLVQWWLLPGLLLPGIVASVTLGIGRDTRRRVRLIWRSWPWWISLLLLRWIASLYTARLLQWQPHVRAVTEVLSALGRTFTIFLLDVLLWYLLLSLVAAHLARASSAGGPETSQPRTAEKP